jgi:hypothetical protein
MLVSLEPAWLGFARECSQSVLAGVDSIYRDTNSFSDSSGYIKRVLQPVLDCSCPNVSGNPQYAVINGQCEAGLWSVISSVFGKYVINGIFQNGWKCTYKYCFSDGSQSSYSEIIYQLEGGCPLTCYTD